MQEGETEEEVNINIEIPPNIFKGVIDDNRKRKAESSADYPMSTGNTMRPSRPLRAWREIERTNLRSAVTGLGGK